MPALRADADEIRTLFSRAMSDMYRAEVPQYGTLMELVDDTNRETLRQHAQLRASLERSDELERLNVERHGAIRLGRADELLDMRRVFAVMGMHPVGYYDLSVAGVPVHADGLSADRRCRAPSQSVPGIHLAASSRSDRG